MAWSAFAFRLGAHCKRILGLEPHGGDRVADLVRHAREHATERCKPFGLGHLPRQRVGGVACVGEACAGKVDGVNDAVEVALARGLELRQCFAARRERGFQLLEAG